MSNVDERKAGIAINYQFSKWSMLSLILSVVCLAWLLLNGVGINLAWVPAFMYIPGTFLAAVAGSAIILKILFRPGSFSLLPAFFALLLGILPLALTWSPAPYGVVFTAVNKKSDSMPVCRSAPVTVKGGSEKIEC